MNLKTFKPNIPVVLEQWGGARHLFQVGAMDCTDILATPEGVLVKLERTVEGAEKTSVVLITAPGHGELAPEELVADDADEPAPRRRGRTAA